LNGLNPQGQHSGDVHESAEIDARQLARILWLHKWLIAGIVFGGCIISVIIALLLPDVYRAKAILAPNESEVPGGLAALATQYGGLASLAGIQLGSGSSDRTAVGLQVLKSRRFVSDFVDRHDLLVPLIAADGWNIDTGELEIDPSVYDVTAKKWVRKVRRPKQTIPTHQEAYEVFMEDVLSVRQDQKTGFVTIAIDHYSPEIAKQWLDWLIDDVNRTVMEKDVKEAQLAIDYLNEKIASTSLAGLQNVFFRMIEEQTKTVMLAQMSSEYLFKTLDPAVVPEEKFSPNRALICILGALLSMLGGILVAVVVDVRSDRAYRQPA
jgi:uncharacterized protein involved in exopolysaccharide biosynthesis